MFTDKLEADLKKAMLARDTARTRTIRSLRAAMLEKEIELREGGKAEVSDDVAMSVVQKQAKQRRDSIDQFEAAGREDLVAKEREELAIIEEYLPEQLTEEDVRKAIEKIINETGAESMKDMGRVMGAAMGRLRGLADGRLVQDIVKKLLSS